MRHATAVAVLAVGLAPAGPASAEDPRLRFRAGGGVVLPAGEITTRFETGGQLMAGAALRLRGALALRLDYGYSRERLVGSALRPAHVEGRHEVHGLELALEWSPNPRGTAPIRLLGGPALCHRKTAVTELTDYAPGPPVCDPWLGVCAPGPVPAEGILGSRSSTDPGFAVAVDVDVPVGGRFAVFFEARWRYVHGDEMGLPGQAGRRSSASYFPLTVGLRF